MGALIDGIARVVQAELDCTRQLIQVRMHRNAFLDRFCFFFLDTRARARSNGRGTTTLYASVRSAWLDWKI